MSIKVRSDLNIASAPAEVATAANYIINYNDVLLADKTEIDAGNGEANGQMTGSHDLGFPLQSSFSLPSHPGGEPAATGDDGSASASEGAPATSAVASPDVLVDPAHAGLDPSEAFITERSLVSADVIGTQIQDVTAGHPGTGLHITPPVDSGFAATAAVLFAPAAPGPVTASLANLAPTAFGAYGAEAGIGAGGAAQVVGHQISHTGSDGAASAESSAVLASPESSAAGSPIANAGVGAGGATAAQVQQALDESGLSVNGGGIKVGVLSDSFNDLGGAAADEADGALPSASNIQVISDLASGGSDEGRAMMQIIHDIAPGASLAFYTAFNSEQDFANGILALAAAGSKVIVDDVSYFDEPFFQNGVVAQAIQTVEAEGVTYVTAAGNEGSNGYQAAWTPISGTFDGQTLTDAESFGGSLVQTISINTEGTGNAVPLLLEWNQAYGAATSDLEILVFHNGSLIGTATNRSSGEPTNPWVGFDFTATGTYQVAIENLSGPNPGLIKEITEGDGLPATISGANTGTVFGHAMTPGAISAGAVSVAYTPAFGFNPAISESFSSSGAGTELLFANNGTALASPDVLSPVTVSGLDDIATTVAGNLGDFYGTSAASASLAGVAALILAADPNLTPLQVEQIMEYTALPMANPAVSGAGLVQVDAAVALAQALNGPPLTVIESSGSTTLKEYGNNFYLVNGVGSGPALEYGGSPFIAGEFGAWTPIGAEQTSDGYDVAFKIPGADQYTVWTADSSGNYVSGLLGVVSGANTALESLELVFHQDLNHDGLIGPPLTVIESSGSTTLKEYGNNFYLVNSVGSGPALEYGGSPFIAGEFGAWTPIGAEQTSGGYDVAFKIPGADQYTVWTADSSGNYVSGLLGVVSGSSNALESIESLFHQDLNGDGTTGPPLTVIEASGSTTLKEYGNNFYLVNSVGSGPALEYGGSPFIAGEFGAWTPIGAEQTSGGCDVAFKIPGADQYTGWTTNSNGNYVSALFGVASGSSTALESVESLFHQDLNGDGTIGIPASGGSTLTVTNANVVLSAGSISIPVTSSSLSGQIVGFAGDGTLQGSDKIDLNGINYNSIHSSYDSSSGVLAVTDGAHEASLEFLGNHSQQNFSFADDGHGGSIVYAQTGASQSPAAGGSNQVSIPAASNVASAVGQDTFVFAPNFGQVTVAHFTPATDTIQISSAVFANTAAVLAATHDDGHGNAVITDAAHDTITIQNVTTAQLLARLGDFHIV
jgi:hypothetical protein